ncbi:porin family protein [Odoribacter lunatus]|uniref:porin family protein n=1 Tax=Odoribacter lunatus TaxID=2941335 RepID=UPI0020424777|nr:porin family protein [Odoribacter lunatus]
MKKLFILVCVALFATTVSAQITWNMKAGFGMANCYGGDAGHLSSHFVGKIGAGIEKPFTSNWSLMPSLELAMKGAKYDIDVRLNGASVYKGFTVDYYYLQVPVVAAYRINIASKWNLTLKAGPYLAYAFAGKIKEGDESFNVFSKDGYGKRFDAGLDFGVDFEYQRFVFGAEYELGFMSIEEQSDIKNGAFYVTVGYKF